MRCRGWTMVVAVENHPFVGDWRVLPQVVGRSDPLRHFLSTQGPKQVLDERDVGLSDKTGRTVEWYNDSHAPTSK